MDAKQIEKQIIKILEQDFWPPGLETRYNYERIQDDHDGTRQGRVVVQITENGDAWLATDEYRGFMRFRNSMGGGMSLRVRNALLILALAIKKDNEKKPQEYM